MPLFEINPKVGVVCATYSEKKRKGKEFSKVDMLTQSGSIISKKVFDKIGYSYEPLFIDAVEFDFFLRARQNKFELVKSTSLIVKHSVGEIKESFGIKFISHSALRNFYFARNHMYLTRVHFFKSPIFIIKKNVFFVLHIFKLIILERDLNKLKNLTSGIFTYLK